MKKVIALLLSIMLTVSFFSGCSKDNAKKDEKTSAYELSYVYDYAYNNLDGSIKDAYVSLCEAVVNYQSELKVNTGIVNNAYDLFNTSFPLSFLVSNFSYLEDGTGIAIKYAKSETEHKQIVKAFNDKAKEYMDKCFEGTNNKAVYAIRAYNLTASTVVTERSVNLNCYDAFVNGRGNENTIFKMFEFLLLQADIPAYHIIASGVDSAPCYLTLAEIGENYYYFDMFGEKALTNGEGIKMFGLNYDELSDYGISEPLTYTQNTPPNSFDTKFDVCRKAVSWELNGTALDIMTDEGDSVQITL